MIKDVRPWRVGKQVGRTIYNVRDELIGVMDTPELARAVVYAINGGSDESARPQNQADVVAARSKGFMEALIGSAQVQHSLDGKTDAEVADLLTHEAIAIDNTSPLSVLLSNAAERLRRAKGGPTAGEET